MQQQYVHHFPTVTMLAALRSYEKYGFYIIVCDDVDFFNRHVKGNIL